MPPWQPVRPTPAATAFDTLRVYSGLISPIVQQNTISSSSIRSERLPSGSSVSNTVTS